MALHQNMVIRLIEEGDYGQVASLCSNFFQTHSIFQKDVDIVKAYLRKEALEREAFLVLEEQEIIKGCVVLVNTGVNKDGTHKRWKFRHFAFESESIASELLEELEKRVRQASATSKIELTIAETEEGADFYKNHGYVLEGDLKNHYRFGESCFVLGKSF